MLNINITLSVIFDGKKTDKELDSAIVALESTIDRLQAKYGQTVAISSPSLSNELVARNKAYLELHGKGRIPNQSDKEDSLRVSFGDSVEWKDIKARREALLTKGYDIFDIARNNPNSKNNETNGETFNGEPIDLTTVPAED